METLSQTHKSNRARTFLLNNLTLSYNRRESAHAPSFLHSDILPTEEMEPLFEKEYDVSLLRLLDDLQSPLLLLPRVKNECSIKRMAFITDVRFTSTSTLGLVVKIAKSHQARITVFNLAESHMPQMDFAYARKLFVEQGFSCVNGLPIELVNLKKTTRPEVIEAALDQYQIDLVSALQKSKDLLYNLAAEPVL